MSYIINLFIPVFLLGSGIIAKPGKSCTVFCINKDQQVLAGSNEDWRDPNTIFQIYPPDAGKHGWIKFGSLIL